MAYQQRNRPRKQPPVTGRLVGRRTGDAGNPGGRSLGIDAADVHANDRREVARIEAEAASPQAAAPGVSSTGFLGEPRLGDETAALGADAPSQGVANDYEDRPSQRRIGEGLMADGVNFQGRPDTSIGGGDAAGSGGGSGL